MSDSPCRYRGPDGGVGETRHTSRHASKVKALVYVQCALSVSTRQSEDTARRCGPVRLRAVREHLLQRGRYRRGARRARPDGTRYYRSTMMDFVAFTRAGAAKKTRPMNLCDTCTRPENHGSLVLTTSRIVSGFPSRLAYNSPSFSGSGCRGRVKRKLARWKWCAPTRHRACSAPNLQARVHDAYEPRPSRSALQDRKHASSTRSDVGLSLGRGGWCAPFVIGEVELRLRRRRRRRRRLILLHPH